MFTLVSSLRTGSQGGVGRKRKVVKRRQLSVALGKKGGGTCRLSFDATHPPTSNYSVTHMSITHVIKVI